MKNLFQITAVSLSLAMFGSVATADNNREGYVEIDPAPSGVEMQEVFVDNTSILGMPGRDAGTVYDGGITSSGQQRTVIDFSNGIGGGSGGGGRGSDGLDDLSNSIIYYEK